MNFDSTAEAEAIGFSPEQYARFSRLLERQGIDLPRITIPVTQKKSCFAPLSFAQQQLWMADKLLPDSPVYNIPAALRLKGVLNLAALDRTLLEVVRRHEVLRTLFHERDGSPVQVIGDVPHRQLSVVSLESLSETIRERELAHLAQKEALRPFNLTRGPLFRTILVRLSEHEHGLLVTLHHIVSDGWSMGILIREVTQLYATYAADKVSSLKELPIQYRDYAVWQREWLQGEVLEQQLAYWKGKLRGELPLLRLSAGSPRSSGSSSRGAMMRVRFSSELSAALQTVSRQEDITVFMLLLASFQILLSRYSGQSDILVGTPIANRTHTEIEGLIGFFVNTLVLRSQLSGELTVKQLLHHVREVTLGAYAHQDLPFERLVQEVTSKRDPSHSSIVQVMLTFEDLPPQQLRFTGLDMEMINIPSRTAAFDLSLLITRRASKLVGAVSYSLDLFDGVTIERMMRHWEVLLEEMVADPEREIGELPLLRGAERRQVLEEWNATRSDYRREACLHELIEEQAAAWPDRVAVVFEDRQLTYGELNRRANQLGHELQRRGVGPEVPVGVCLERSLELMIALLAVLKAGGVYVPLDPMYPQARLSFIAEDAGVTAIITNRSLHDILPEQLPRLDLDAETSANEAETPITSGVTSAHLAYVIYTSGSTGRPKGVMNTHSGIVNRLQWMQEKYGLTGSDRVLQKTTMGFDVSVWEFFWPLMTGVSVVLARPGGQQDPGYLAQVTVEEGITVLHFVPSMLEAWLQDPASRTCVSLRHIFSSGEALGFSQQERILDSLPAELHNLYGPTEAAVDVTSWRCREDRGRRPVPIGRPIANTQIYVLDVSGQPVPVGVPGELYIGGAGLARGYRGRPELTAERFVPDPFGPAGGRLYRTGDLARYRADGTLEYLGRMDHQVKLRGFRIELGEIEAVLRQCPGVSDAVVMVREDQPGRQQLAGYLVGDIEDVAEVRESLKRQLPDYMVPTAWLVLKQLPLTASGKIDRRALTTAKLNEKPLEYMHTSLTARDLLEFQLTQLWEQSLGIEPIGVRDDFFEMGGYSMQAIAMMAAIQKQFGKAVPLSMFIETPTVEHLAILLRHGPESPTLVSCLVPLQPLGGKPPFFCAPPAGGTPIPYRTLARHLGKDQPFYGFQAPGLEDGREPLTNLTQLANYYIEAMQNLQPVGPYFLGGWSAGGRVALEMAQQLQKHGHDVRLLAIFDEQIEAPALPILVEDDAEILFSMVSGRLQLELESLRNLAPNERLIYVLKLAKQANLVPPDYGLPQALRLFEVFKASALASAKYQPYIYAGKVTLFWARENLKQNAETQSTLWRALTTGDVENYVVPGNHLTLMDRANVKVLAHELRACLDRAQRSA